VRVVYFGSSSFSAPPLTSVLPHVSCVVTRKAKPKGRGYHLEVNEITKIAMDSGLPLIEIDSFRDQAARGIEEYKPDLLVVASFGLIIPKWALDIPSIGPLNIHPSLLPRYRGPSPIQWSIWNGERGTGITFIKMNEKMDEGDILYQEPVAIEPQENATTLSEKLAVRAGAVLPEFIEGLAERGMGHGIVQNGEDATYTPIITKEMGRIDWSLGAMEATRQIRALVGWPVAYTYLDGLLLKVFDGQIYDPGATGEPGLVTGVTREGFLVATPNGSVLVSEVQLENKKRLRAYQFAQGYRGLTGKRLGEGL
jgi:methionyl-tRNA formyltransferase